MLADGVGHGTESADRGNLHDHADDTEQHVRQLFDQFEHRLAALAEGMHGIAEQDGEKQHLQHVALGEGIDHAGRDDVDQEIGGRLHLARADVLVDALGVERARVDIHAAAGRPDVDHDQADDQGDGAHHLEIQHGVTTGLADLLHVFHAGNADDDGAEDDRGDDHLDQLDEGIAKRLHGCAGFGIEMPQSNADGNGHQHLEIQTLEYRFFRHLTKSPQLCIRTSPESGRQYRHQAFVPPLWVSELWKTTIGPTLKT